MSSYVIDTTGLSEETRAFYRRAVHLLNAARLPFLVGGTYALTLHTGIVRPTKDFDIFVRPDDVRRALEALAAGGCSTELPYAHWLGKAYHGTDFVDVIFSSGNGVAKVDDGWFAHAVPAVFLGEPVLVCPVEETIWSKSFVCERERYDGADINHLLLARGADLDWVRLLRRFNGHWRVLLSHLVMFGFVYPSERDVIPPAVMDGLIGRLRRETDSGAARRRVCHGTLLSRVQYVVDMDEWGYGDARLDPDPGMTPAQARHWTAAGMKQEEPPVTLATADPANPDAA